MIEEQQRQRKGYGKLIGLNETIQLQDLIMLTDIFSLPNLITLLSKSELNDKELEF